VPADFGRVSGRLAHGIASKGNLSHAAMTDLLLFEKSKMTACGTEQALITT
jgi:hypothetical protein